jgi:hypothetical protein
MSRLAFCFVAILSFGVVTLAQDKAPTLHESDLKGTALAVAGDMTLTVLDLKGGLFGQAPIVVEVEIHNPTDTPIVFNPFRLSFVKADGRQLDVLAVPLWGEHTADAHEILVLPKARVRQLYFLNGRINLPAKMYYDARLLAEIVN